MIRWADVMPWHWFYRDVLEAERIYINPNDEHERLIMGLTYDVFELPRIVKVYTSEDMQKDFDLPGYIPDDNNPVYVYVDGVPVMVADTQEGKVSLAAPVSGGLEVVVMAVGKPRMEKSYGCSMRPVSWGNVRYPRATLGYHDTYDYNVYYHYNETAVSLNKTLKRLDVQRYAGESVEDALGRVIGNRRNCYTIIDGVLYTSYDLNELPVHVCYNFKEGSVVKHICEKVVVKSPSGRVAYNDRFFPNTETLRHEFFLFLQRMRKNIYQRYTDRTYRVHANNERNIPDIDEGSWYYTDVMDVLNEKFLDGCYVFPLYEDGTFRPDACITRAEAVYYLNRFIEWALERFR